MNERNLVVCDREFRYANGLGENISERSELAFRVHTCTGAAVSYTHLRAHET